VRKIAVGVFLMALATMAEAGYVRGLATCAEWSKARTVEAAGIAETSEAEAAAIYEAWLVGFLSGIAMQRDTEVLKGVDVSSIYLDVDEYCRDHPRDTTAQAGRDHMRELEERAGVIPKAVKK